MLDSGKTVLVAFYKPSCELCEKLETNLAAVSKRKGNKVVVIRINADENVDLMKELFVGEMPVLHLYKNKKLTWASTGLVKKREILKQSS